MLAGAALFCLMVCAWIAVGYAMETMDGEE